MDIDERCKKDIVDYDPDGLVLIDFPGFNLKIAKFCKRNNIKVDYYIPPKTWAWNSKRNIILKKNINSIYSILPFEKNYFMGEDIDINYIGNPLVHRIKKNKLKYSKLANVLKELSFLRKLMEKHQIEITDDLFTQLKEINLTLWNIEDQIRIKEKNKEFDNTFIELARSVYFKNDKRAEIKKRINQLSNSEITEEKSYAEY